MREKEEVACTVSSDGKCSIAYRANMALSVQHTGRAQVYIRYYRYEIKCITTIQRLNRYQVMAIS